MRILFLAESLSIHSERWIRFFAERGHEIDWISLSPSDTAPAFPNTRFHPIVRGPAVWRAITAARLARRIVRERRIDLVHAHYAGTYGVIGAMTRFHPLVLTAWGSDILEAGRTALYGPLVRFALRAADAITCDAEHLRDAMHDLGVPRDRVRIIYFGTDTEWNHPGRARPERRADFGAGDGPVVISARNMHPVYDIGTLIRAVPLVLAAQPDTRFAIAGDGPERPALEELARSLGVERSVRFLGPLPASLIAEHLASADVYVSTSTSDGGLAATTAEAMACGTPVVITDFGQNRVWVDDGRSGRLFPVRDHAALAAELLPLLRDPQARRALGQAGRDVIRTRNDYHREMARVEALYVSLVRGKAAPRP